MRVALLDPSLFTLPYDAALMRALFAAGDEVVLHARRPDPIRDGVHDPVPITGRFYRLAEHPAIRRLPPRLRLTVKGLDHAASLVDWLRLLAAEPPDVVHVQWLPLPVFDLPALALLGRRAPLVLTVHDTEPFNGNPAAFVQRIGQSRALRFFDRLIVHTEQGAARLFAQGVGREKVAVLPHGAYPPAQPRKPATGEVEFLLLGKIKPYKGADLLIEAFALMPEALRRKSRVRIAGMPYMDLDPLRQAAQRLGIADRVQIDPGFIAESDISEYFGKDTVAVFPYREIEASGVLALAASYGVPMIATGLGSFAETLIDGRHGRLVARGDVAGLAAAMAEMVADRGFRSRAAASVSELARGWPAWAEVAEGTRRVYADARRHWAARRTRATTHTARELI